MMNEWTREQWEQAKKYSVFLFYMYTPNVWYLPSCFKNDGSSSMNRPYPIGQANIKLCRKYCNGL